MAASSTSRCCWDSGAGAVCCSWHLAGDGGSAADGAWIAEGGVVPLGMAHCPRRPFSDGVVCQSWKVRYDLVADRSRLTIWTAPDTGPERDRRPPDRTLIGTALAVQKTSISEEICTFK